MVGELPDPFRVEPLERGQPDAAQVLGLRVWVLVREPPEIRGWGGGRQCVAAGPLAAAFEGGRGGGAHMWDMATVLGKEISTGPPYFPSFTGLYSPPTSVMYTLPLIGSP